MPSIQEEIQKIVNDHQIVLFMKGNKDFPQCGYSAVVVKILGDYGVKFFDVNVLASPEIRQGIKDFSDWPTIPQLYVKGEFVGGCDIVRELHSSGELSKILNIE